MNSLNLTIFLRKAFLPIVMVIFVAGSFSSCKPSKPSPPDKVYVSTPAKIVEPPIIDEAHQFLMDLISQGALDKTYNLNLNCDNIDQKNINRLLKLEKEPQEIQRRKVTSNSESDSNWNPKKNELPIEYNTKTRLPLPIHFSNEDKSYLKNQFSKITQASFENAALGFNLKNEEHRYHLSYPVFTKDGKNAILQVTRGGGSVFGGSGYIYLFTQDENKIWQKKELHSWFH